MTDDREFQFVFTHQDALEAVADISRRLALGRAFGYADNEIRHHGYSPMAMMALGWYLDPVTEYWVPHWWPEWAK